MPHFLLSLEKTLSSEKWTNVYYMHAADLATAVTQGNAVREIEKGVTKSTVTFSHMLVSEREQPFRNYHSESLSEVGLVAPTSGELPLPLWNTVRCEFQPSNNGKPDVKQLRLPLYTDEMLTITRITTAVHTAVLNNYATALVGLGYIEDDAGNAWTSGIVRLEIFERQLKKRRRKKVHTV